MAGSTKLMTASGGGVVITPASSIASDVTVNVPSQNCTLGIQGPAFSAYQSSAQTSLSSNTWTKLLFQTEEFDTNNNFTSSVFTPTVAGYYQVTAGFSANTNASGAYGVSIYKNGTTYKKAYIGFVSGSVLQPATNISGLVYFNGTTDYIESYGYINGGGQPNTGTEFTYFQASLVRAA